MSVRGILGKKNMNVVHCKSRGVAATPKRCNITLIRCIKLGIKHRSNVTLHFHSVALNYFSVSVTLTARCKATSQAMVFYFRTAQVKDPGLRGWV
jgi:hypothetical protein